MSVVVEDSPTVDWLMCVCVDWMVGQCPKCPVKLDQLKIFKGGDFFLEW